MTGASLVGLEALEAPTPGRERGMVSIFHTNDMHSNVVAGTPLANLFTDALRKATGSALVTAWFTPAEVKNLLEFFLVDDPNHPGEFFPRFDQVVSLELVGSLRDLPARERRAIRP